MSAVAQLTTASVLLKTARWQVFTLLCMACHVVLVRDVGAFCFPLLLLCLVFVNRHDSLAGFIMYLQILLYQNVMVSVFSEQMTKAGYTFVSGTSFAAAAIMASWPGFRLLRTGRAFRFARPELQRIVLAVISAGVVALLYTMLGAVDAGPTPAAVGFRNAVAMLLALMIGLETGDRWSYRTIATCFLASTLLGIGLSGLEIADPAGYLGFIHAADFGNVKFAASDLPPYYTVENLIGQLTALPFNTDLLTSLLPGEAYRFGGPNMHSISYGYVLAVTELTLLSLGWGAFVLPLLLLSFLIGVKGAAILLCGSVLLQAVWRTSRSRLILFGAGTALCTAYVAYGIMSGLQAGDFHVIGFIGGVNGFLKNPLGHGIGVGGNLSLGNLTLAKWQEFQQNGADVGLESAVGVLIYQMGVGSLAIAAPLFLVFRAAGFVKMRQPRWDDVQFIGLFICLVNGIFQEEAYSPYAAGLLCLFCGVLVANGDRPPSMPHPGRAGR